MFALSYKEKLESFLKEFQRVKANLEEIIRMRGLVEQREISRETSRIAHNMGVIFETLSQTKMTVDEIKAQEKLEVLGGHDKVCKVGVFVFELLY
jgi:hypothetical protein